MMSEQEKNLRDALFGYMVENTDPHCYLVEDDPRQIESMINRLVMQTNYEIRSHNAGARKGYYSAQTIN